MPAHPFLRRILALGLCVFAGVALLGAAVADAADVALIVKMRGPNTGAVSVVPLGLVCNPSLPGDCTFAVPSGTTLTLFANAPATPGVFSAGAGSAVGCATSACTFTITTPSEVTA